MGRAADADFYLRLFRAAAPERFACIAVDSVLLADAGDAVVLDLCFLRALGLLPVVVVGTFQADVEAVQARRLQQSLAAQGVTAALVGGAQPLAGVRRAVAAGHLPILPLTAGADAAARLQALSTIALALRTRKVVVLEPRGALRMGGRRVPLVNLSRGLGPLRASGELAVEQSALLDWAHALICGRPSDGLTVALTSPLDLLRELFTVGGAGTLLRRGAEVSQQAGWCGVDRPRLQQLLSSAFGRPLATDFFARPPTHLVLEAHYRGAALLQATPRGTYLSKFAVEREAQGEGIGHDLWEVVCAVDARLFWRARASNPVVSWYARQCDGLQRLEDWHVFWRGIAPAQLPAVIAYALAQPRDFI